MNSNTPFEVFSANEREELTQLAELAQTLQPDERFLKRTEGLLKQALFVEKENRMKRFSFLWQSLAGTTAIVALTLLIIWLVKGVAPEMRVTPVPALQATLQPATPTAEATTLPSATPALPAYERFGTTIYRAVDFPTAPAEAGLRTYSASEQPATVETARALAQRLGIDGQVYEGGNYGYRYLISDRKQRLLVNSDQSFLYFSTNQNLRTFSAVPLDIAQPAIEAYLEAHGFNFDYKIRVEDFPGGFTVVPLTTDGLPILYGSSQIQGLSVVVSSDGQVLQVQANLLASTEQNLGQFAILSAEEAWQKFLDPTTMLGAMESSGSGGQAPNAQTWYRAYPDNQPTTLYCGATIYPATETGQPPLITCDDYILSGDLAGLEASLDASLFSSFVVIQGQFKTDAAEVRTFEVTSWQKSDLQQQYLSNGEVRREGDQVVFASVEATYLLAEVPPDFPIPAQDVSGSGVIVDNVFKWSVLGIHMPFGGGGGGGGAFAKLNLSGTPIPWPTPEPVVSPTPSTFLGQRLEGVRGDLRIFIYQKADGSQQIDYNFSPKADVNYTTYLLDGSDLAQLDDNHNRPVDIWGSITGYTPAGIPILTVERSVIPYPDLKFQILRGKQKISSVDGQIVTLLSTADGQIYVQLSGSMPDANLIGAEADLVDVIALVVPDETFGGYPVAQIFGGWPASETGEAQKLEDLPGGPDQPFVIRSNSPSTSVLPVLTIEGIDLGYYIADPYNSPSTGAYLQPVWRLYGHYSNGDYFECLVQALRPEYLYPEEEQTGN